MGKRIRFQLCQPWSRWKSGRGLSACFGVPTWMTIRRGHRRNPGVGRGPTAAQGLAQVQKGQPGKAWGMCTFLIVLSPVVLSHQPIMTQIISRLCLQAVAKPLCMAAAKPPWADGKEERGKRWGGNSTEALHLEKVLRSPEHVDHT